LSGNRQNLAEISEKSERLVKGMEFINDLNKKIEILLKSYAEIKL
jgi:hypothetical protein